jgi:hypothetical protein
MHNHQCNSNSVTATDKCRGHSLQKEKKTSVKPGAPTTKVITSRYNTSASTFTKKDHQLAIWQNKCADNTKKHLNASLL